ncbi:MAG TPA: SH3 domain-containing protein [Edaphocola sp.]|nr:SH3 domain-containing protein [Edaphocola sp.]
MKNIICLFLLLISIEHSFSQDIVQMRKEGGVYTMPCEVNGLKLRFIFDTGASDVSISLAEAIFMLKNGYLSKSDIKGSTYYQIANGDIVEGTTINLRKIKIGNKYLYNVNASIVHSTSSPLLLGQSALSRIGKFSFDYSNNTLVFGSGDNFRNKDNYDYSPSYNRESSKTYTTTMKIAGKLRSSDSPVSSIIKYIPANAAVRVIENKDGYWKVFYDGKTGYLNEMYLNITYNMSTMQKQKGNVQSTNIGSNNYEITTMKIAGKLRSSDSPVSSIIKYIPANATVKVIENKDGYWKVFYDGKTGYLNEMYLNITYNMSLMKK